MYAGKPVIGVIGGIGSGKSFVSSLFGELGACVIQADQLVHEAYKTARVQEQLRQWWPDAIDAGGTVNKKAIAARVFADPEARKQLEGLLHPIVNQMREEQMRPLAADDRVMAFVWDTPLLVETGLHTQCDAVVFVEAPLEIRLARVAGRGWGASELARREKFQLPLDNKRHIADYVVSNATEAEAARRQVRQVFTQIQQKLGNEGRTRHQ